jgi:hypothetical protein
MAETDEFAIHFELTEVVDDDAEAAVSLLVEEAFEEGRLARAEETGQESHLHGFRKNVFRESVRVVEGVANFRSPRLAQEESGGLCLRGKGFTFMRPSFWRVSSPWFRPHTFVDGTGSYPYLPHGWQRSKRHAARALPLMAPWPRRASMA